MTRPIAHRALYQEVADRIRRLVLAGELTPGARIDERALAARFGISRTPLREALKVLHAEGLVRLTPRRGTFVSGEPTDRDLDDIFPVMALLDGLCARQAAARATREDVARLETLHARLEREAGGGDVERASELEYAFHEAVQALAANAWLSRAASELRRPLRLLRGPQRDERSLAASAAAHRLLIRALERGDAEGAERIMRAHVASERAALAAGGVPRARSRPRRRRGGTP